MCKVVSPHMYHSYIWPQFIKYNIYVETVEIPDSL